MDIQRVRNLTTGRLHTDIGCVYQDIEYLVGAEGIFTHMLPNASRALEPFLRKRITDPRFWEDKYDTTHAGEIEVAPLTEEEQKEFWQSYGALPSPLAGKDVIAVKV